MRSRGWVVLLAVGLCGCGSDDSNLTLSTPPPPVTTPLDGLYDLVITPAEGCALPDAPYQVVVAVESFEGSAGTELRATLTGNDATLVVEMLYSPPGWLRGSVSTLTWIGVGSSEIFVRASGTGLVTRATGGRAEVESGTIGGEVSVALSDGDVLTCTSIGHGWSLKAR